MNDLEEKLYNTISSSDMYAKLAEVVIGSWKASNHECADMPNSFVAYELRRAMLPHVAQAFIKVKTYAETGSDFKKYEGDEE